MTNAIILHTIGIQMSKVAILQQVVMLWLSLGKHWETWKKRGVGS